MYLQATSENAALNINETILGIPEADHLSRLLTDAGKQVNNDFAGAIVTTERAPGTISVGSIEVQVIGPMELQLEELRRHWRRWLDQHPDYSMFSGPPRSTDIDDVTVPNLASIMFLASEDDQRMLFTGDGHSEHLLEGLDHVGLGGKQHFDVLKVPHHGSDNNMTEEFCQTVTANHYVFCANGAHHNPDLSIMEMIFTARVAGAGPAKPFSFWFNNGPDTVHTSGQTDHMQEVLQEARRLQSDSSNRLRCYFRRQSQPSLVVEP